jgi:hypothetical protein
MFIIKLAVHIDALFFKWNYKKPNYFKKQSFLSSFSLTQVNIQGGLGHRLLSRLVPCIEDMEIAF